MLSLSPTQTSNHPPSFLSIPSPMPTCLHAYHGIHFMFQLKPPSSHTQPALWDQSQNRTGSSHLRFGFDNLQPSGSRPRQLPCWPVLRRDGQRPNPEVPSGHNVSRCLSTNHIEEPFANGVGQIFLLLIIITIMIFCIFFFLPPRLHRQYLASHSSSSSISALLSFAIFPIPAPPPHPQVHFQSQAKQSIAKQSKAKQAKPHPIHNPTKANHPLLAPPQKEHKRPHRSPWGISDSSSSPPSIPPSIQIPLSQNLQINSAAPLALAPTLAFPPSLPTPAFP
ncbi:hypothetical protein MFRU_004g03850 [Monilinia fructicola]|nr:hypothetical protein MFRU_004g03850 [Monilinia fructicola]